MYRIYSGVGENKAGIRRAGVEVSDILIRVIREALLRRQHLSKSTRGEGVALWVTEREA